MPGCTHLRLLSVVLTISGLLALPAYAQPTISQATPFAVRAGEPTEIDLVGDKLAGALQLVTSFSAQVEVVSQEPQRVRVRLTASADTNPQIGALVACTAEGATDAVWLVIDDLPTVLDQGANHQLTAAQEVPFGTGVDATADGTEADYYRVPLVAGQRLAAEVLASRCGSACDPVVRLLTADGRELLAVDDIEGRGGDCYFEYVAKEEAPVVIEVRDNKYQSGVRYRLRIGDLPLTLASFPLGMKRGTTAQLRLPTLHPDQTFSSIVSASTDRWKTRLPINARSASGTASLGEVALSDCAEYCELEPNNGAEHGTEISVPSGFSGIISDPADKDVFLFPAKAGQQFVFRTTARSLGSPAFPLLRLLNSAGQVIAESAYTDSDEISLPFVSPADGIYQLHVDELTQRGGPQFVYRIEASDVPFRLTLKNAPESQFRLAAPTVDGALVIDLQCERTGYNGPIALSIEPSWPGMELFQTVMPAGAAEHRLFVAFNQSMPIGTLQPFRVIGQITNGTQQQAAAATTITQLRTRWPGMTPIPGWHDGLFLVSSTAAASPLLKIQTDAKALFVPRGNGTTQLVVTAERLNAEYKDPLAFVTGHFPENVSPAVAVEGDKFTVTITNAGNNSAGIQNVSLGVYGTFSGRPQLARILLPLDINDPLAPSVAPLQLKAGTTDKLKVTLVRRGTDRQPVMLAFQNLPAGITIPEIMLPAEQDSIDVDVTAAAEAAAGTYEAIQVIATSQYAGQPTTACEKFTITVPAP